MRKHFGGCEICPCSCEHIGYRYLFFVSFLGAALESLIAWHWGGSGAAGADAVHAFSHSFLYLIGLYVCTRKITEHERDHLRSRGYVLAACVLFAILAYIAFEAIRRFYDPAPVMAGFMKAGVFLGLMGNIFSLFILQKIKKVLEKDNKLRKVLGLDALLDLMISIAVLFTAFFVHLNYFVDPVVTFAAVAVISVKGFGLLKENPGHHH
ncbi:cation transporter [Candidatus Giovannonibacteria bacterium]|nr:cation transporter [Candidatus Giovannonibacteria bacterium]